MKGHFYKRGCTCKKKKCTCGAKWDFVIDIGIDPETGKRRQKTKSGFINNEEAVTAAAALLQELNLGTYLEETDQTFVNLPMSGFLFIVKQKTLNPEPFESVVMKSINSCPTFPASK